MNVDKSEEERIQAEYATQFLGFTPDSFTDTITFTAQNILEEQLKILQKRVVKECGSAKVSSRQMEQCFVVVRDQYASCTDRVLSKLSQYLQRNILSIPKDVLLPEDLAHRLNTAETTPCSRFTGKDLENSVKQVDQMCDRVRQAKYKRAVLQVKLANLEKVQLQQKRLLKEVTNLWDTKQSFQMGCDQQLQLLQQAILSIDALFHTDQQQPSSSSSSPSSSSTKENVQYFAASKKFRLAESDSE